VPKITESGHIDASLAEVWDHYFDTAQWAEWVEGFQAVVEVDDTFPAVGGVLKWRSIPAGRGEVTERVIEHEHRRLHAIEFEDPSMTGTQRTTFAIDGDGTKVQIELSYRLANAGALTRIAGVFFIKGQVGGALTRTLVGLKHSCEEAAHFAS
jgi:hypothetical protein